VIIAYRSNTEKILRNKEEWLRLHTALHPAIFYILTKINVAKQKQCFSSTFQCHWWRTYPGRSFRSTYIFQHASSV